MPIPQEEITLVERASCPFHQLMKGFLQEVYWRIGESYLTDESGGVVPGSFRPKIGKFDT
ncbi:hypothetical protein QUB70_12920 [Microcoleus sp. A003_D6]|uniref:hypothetical protein n=1 Tax=Microcoleus sp. A003_D6 TaxID=3055266 RepID=UPI002FD166C9